jgi:hypothetical protein
VERRRCRWPSEPKWRLGTDLGPSLSPAASSATFNPSFTWHRPRPGREPMWPSPQTEPRWVLHSGRNSPQPLITHSRPRGSSLSSLLQHCRQSAASAVLVAESRHNSVDATLGRIGSRNLGLPRAVSVDRYRQLTALALLPAEMRSVEWYFELVLNITASCQRPGITSSLRRGVYKAGALDKEPH